MENYFAKLNSFSFHIDCGIFTEKTSVLSMQKKIDNTKKQANVLKSMEVSKV